MGTGWPDEMDVLHNDGPFSDRESLAENAILIEESWVPSQNAQAVMRLCRIGQKNPVRARVFSLFGSVDERVTDVLTDKTRELAKIL